jgi:tripartite-type tricarboxylate transporter receptor subunit TctC
MLHKFIVACVTAVLGFALAPLQYANAEDYPARTITIYVPFAPGGYTDLLARVVAVKLTDKLGKPVIVENRPGGGTLVAAVATAKAAPDGYTLMMVPNGTIATNPTLYKSLPYDPLKDFAPVAMVASGPLVLLVNPEVPAKNVTELIKLAKEKPGALNYGSPSGGANIAVFMSMFQNLAGIQMTEIPYRGVIPMITDAISGRIQVMFADIASARGFLAEGKLRALAVSTAQRFKDEPNIPTIAESGLPGFDGNAWQMLVAPSKTPKEVVALLNREINAIVKAPDVSETIVKYGLIPGGSGTPDELMKFSREEVARWGDVLRKAGIAGTQ